MIKSTALAALLFVIAISNGSAQNASGVLTVAQIMQDPQWMGSSPSSVRWGIDKQVYFLWNPNHRPADSLYKISVKDKTPQRLTIEEEKAIAFDENLRFNQKRTAATWARQGTIYYRSPEGKTIQVLQGTGSVYAPVFGFNDSKIVYTQNNNLYAWDITSGTTEQLTNFLNNYAEDEKQKLSPEEEWLKKDQLATMQVLKERAENTNAAQKYAEQLQKKSPRKIYLKGAFLQNASISPDGNLIAYTLYKQSNGKRTIVPNYITESGFTADMNGRTKVGSAEGSSSLYVYDRLKDTVYTIDFTSIPGIRDVPAFFRDYPKVWTMKTKDSSLRKLTIAKVDWSPDGKNALLDVYANDNKDRWILLMEAGTRRLTLADRQHDDAWIGGPGIGARATGWINSQTIWFQSEATGYSHLYTYSLPAQSKTALTSGNYEVQQAQLSHDKKCFYITTNEVHPGEKQFYQLNIISKKKERITTLEGANEISISPDEKYIAFLHSYIDQPWELYLQENKSGAKAQQVTFKAKSDSFNQYKWRAPEVISFTARDGATVYARLYKPTIEKQHAPVVFFVHGAGYLQNAHKWWSSYFREYMFNNLLADNGYYVMDIDYRGSAGYGRDWRTGIYRHMGGKDLTDHVDAVKYLAKNYSIDTANIGIYGGSYGGFMTLMALFTTPEVFKSGAALRPVTDWANYNHGYTSNILNEPFTDSIAYHQSSPIYFANGLKGHLLICHGMVDVNVHYQDAVKLSQRLIELGKDNWELASYPMEDHGFVEPSSWTDEYKRIFKLFEQTLKN